MGLLSGMSLGLDLGSIIGGAASAYGNYRASQVATQKQIDWERERATHAHQWEVEDLKQAGLNPILSAGGSGAATSGISPAIADYSSLAGISTSAAKVKEAKIAENAQKALQALQEEQINATKSQAKLNEATAKNEALDAELKNARNKAEIPALETETAYNQSKVGKTLRMIGIGAKDLTQPLNIIGMGLGGFALRGLAGRAVSAAGAARAAGTAKAINKLPPKGKLLNRMDRGLKAQEKWEHIPAYLWRPK